MSLHHLPDGYTALRDVPGARYDAQNICYQQPGELTLVQYLPPEPLDHPYEYYFAGIDIYGNPNLWRLDYWPDMNVTGASYPYAQDSYEGNYGSFSEPKWNPCADYIIGSGGSLSDSPRNLGITATVRMKRIHLQASDPIGTPAFGEYANDIGQPAGSGVTEPWETASSERAGPYGLNIHIGHKIGDDEWVIWNAGAHKPFAEYDPGLLWINFASHTTQQTPLDMLIEAPDGGVVMSADDQIRLLFSHDDGTNEVVSAVFATITVTFYYEIVA
jgi:hypothetical protein